MEKIMEVLRSADVGYIYLVLGIVVILSILSLIWVMFLKKGTGPTAAEVKNAEIALSDAKKNEADLYSEGEYKKAEDSLARATYFMSAKDNRKAKKALDEATEQAHKSGKTVEENKAKMKVEDERMLVDFNRQVDELKTSVAKTGTDMPSKVSREVQELVGSWEIMKMRIPDLIQRGRIRVAYDELKTIAGALNNAQRQASIAAG